VLLLLLLLLERTSPAHGYSSSNVLAVPIACSAQGCDMQAQIDPVTTALMGASASADDVHRQSGSQAVLDVRRTIMLQVAA